MKKNDKVVLTRPLPLTYSKEVLPIGTELIVWKVPRKSDVLMCSIVNSKIGGISVYPHKNQVQPVVRNCPMPKVGDLFYSSWGYEQTNIDFYQVTTVKNRMVGITPIAGNAKYDQAMAGHTKPFIDPATNKTVLAGKEKFHLVKFDTDDRPYFKLNSYSSAWPTTLEADHFFSEWH